jgi:hypothetical protein
MGKEGQEERAGEGREMEGTGIRGGGSMRHGLWGRRTHLQPLHARIARRPGLLIERHPHRDYQK